MSIEVEVKGSEEIARLLERLPLKILKKVDEKLGEGAEAVAEKAREIVPVRTGYLRSTIAAVRISLLNWKVQASAFYAKFVEYGTSRMAPRSFLRTSLILTRNLVTSLVRQGLAEAVEERRS